MTILDMVFVWYLWGVIVLLLAATIHSYRGNDITAGDILGAIFLACAGPTLPFVYLAVWISSRETKPNVVIRGRHSKSYFVK